MNGYRRATMPAFSARAPNLLLSRRMACLALGQLAIGCTAKPVDRPTTTREPSALLAQQHAALGRIVDIPARIRPAFQLDGFDPPPPPRSGDWRSTHNEMGESFEEYVHTFPQVPTMERSALALRVMGDLSIKPEIIREYLEIFYSLPVILLPRSDDQSWAAMSKVDKNGQRQVFASDALDRLQPTVPENAFACVGLTEDLLLGNKALEQVYAVNEPERRVGVMTFAGSVPLPPRGSDVSSDVEMLRRYLKSASHEIGHTFGFAHCVYFACNMAGAASPDEADRRPAHVCPICLRKLYWATRANLVGRYQKLASFYTRYGMATEAAWVTTRSHQLVAPAQATL
jgi:archaemetzincin